MQNKPYNLEERLVDFAADIALFSKAISNDFIGQYYGRQLLRSAGSSVLNFGEAQGINSDRDYINKASISVKELKESKVNLKILTKINYGDTFKRLELLDEVEPLFRIIATIIKNKK